MDAIALKDDRAGTGPGVSFKTILIIAVLAAFTILITWRARVLETTLQSESERSEMVDRRAPDFSASTLDGRTVSLAEFHGQKKVVVGFWASWCRPCRQEMPVLIEFYKKNHGASSDFEILAVSIDQDIRDAADFATTQKLNFTVLLDPKNKVADAYQVDGIPAMFVIDKDGKIIYGHIGYNKDMKDELASVLGIRKKTPAEGEP
jgi:peroxiredoxin